MVEIFLKFPLFFSCKHENSADNGCSLPYFDKCIILEHNALFSYLISGIRTDLKSKYFTLGFPLCAIAGILWDLPRSLDCWTLSSLCALHLDQRKPSVTVFFTLLWEPFSILLVFYDRQLLKKSM